ncbi:MULTISPECIES: TonB-dependent receptor [unclassified Cellulophaga]|uniref:TonB-dependent receptor n=1 Tax=unclassified Cellulophaga TaxID=2634405 RepID=UPI0026E3B794|nr:MULTISPECIES: TonB-dependent receptor [unclassified Cellulophaga]MDO6491353.1 TonB-dependent receptor [Cellulophaga sp. 2_MG-2023]MDO6495114.1 TonB-dependent receptor [Cellulophaga sp. 3_MG-2023]
MKKIFMLAILLVSLGGYAQKKYNGKVVDTYNNPLQNATIQLQSNLKNTVVTDKDGKFSITTLQDKPIAIIRYVGYVTRTQELFTQENNITLTLNEERLKEVVVSGSREVQQRSDVPASISVITAKQIEEAKAIGIDQLVNNVPGVLMSTSRAASNEQHFMSVRSPISTKSLFLYLEDGLPIRPTAVFNHNTLLEMNDISYDRMEVIKGPASSIYGSESIGGSFNFITKQPTRDLSGGITYQVNDLGLSKYSLELSQYASEKVGFYIGAQCVQRKDGPVEHSNYEKFALTFKNVNHLSQTLNWTNVFDIIEYRSDMSGSISEEDYSAGNYESDQTFTEREAVAFRVRSTLDKRWNSNNKTTLNLVFRRNGMDQIPSYRVSQFRENGRLTGVAKGEINSNSYNSYVSLIQHKINFNFASSSLIIGASVDYSPQSYNAENISVIVDTNTGKNLSYTTNSGDYILNYNADILNYANYFQFEINPTENVKLTASVRYDGFDYNYNNLIDGLAGPKDSKNNYNNISPKLGINYNLNNNIGLYSNYSNGFTPPQTSTLYRNSFVGVGGDVFNLKPSNYDNFELGTYFKIGNKLQTDAAIYLLDGKNTLVTLRDNEDNFFNANAGKTRSYGVEYGVTYNPTKEITITHNGSYAKHSYVNFFDGGVDYSDTDRETAPKLLGTSKIAYKPSQVKGLMLSLTHEMVGKYNTSFENQVKNSDDTFGTATYKGHNIFNALVSYNIKNYEIWVNALNIFDDLYAARASYNKYRGANSYTIGNPRAFHLGIKYNF